MLFLDVTSSCKSAKNTGMQRMTRKIFLELAKRVPTTPICWNLAGRRYQSLGPRERDVLERPFRVLPRPTARPELRGENFVAELGRLVSRRRIWLETELGLGDVLLIPDLFRDGRMRFLPRLISKSAARSVAIFHDAAALRLPLLYSGARPRFQAYIEALAAFDLVVCISNESRDELHRLWRQYETKGTETCVELWPVEFPLRERQAPLENQRNLIVCVGSFEPRKNHLTLLRAAETLWQQGLTFELELIGRSTGYYGHKIISELKRLQKQCGAICWSKHVDDRALHRAYRDCRFSVYPSLMEGFGLPIVESLWHGKPCICGGNGALGEVTRGGGCLVVDQTSEDAIAAGIKKLLTDQEIYTRLCTEAQTRKFRSWQDYTQELLGHLQLSPREGSIHAVSEV